MCIRNPAINRNLAVGRTRIMLPRFARSNLKIVTLSLVILITVLFHYGVLYRQDAPFGHVFHAIHGRLCYIPIILAAIWFGLRGGLVTATVLSLLVLPYGLRLAGEDVHSLTTEVTEIVFYFGIAFLAGVLTEVQRKERDRREALARELDRTNRLSELGEMAAGIAHEIKNPLGSIRGAAEILGDEIPAGHEKREFIEILSRESKRLERSVDTILDHARSPRDRFAAEDLAQLLDSVVRQVRLEAEAQRVALTLRKNGGPFIVHLDEEKIRQVFLNLISNSLQAFPVQGGHIDITVRSPVTTDHSPGETFAEVTVKDDGPGIEASDLERVFIPFYTTKAKGTGLGLALSHKIIELHGGSLQLSSRKDEGTTARVLLPLAPEGIR